MKTSDIKEIQREIGVVDDGKWGPKSKAACKEYLASLMPSPNPWPYYKDIEQFYGKAGTNLTRIDVTGLGVQYGNIVVNSITVNKKCADSLLDVLTEISQSEYRYLLALYAGCYNNRDMRGGGKKSVHAYAAAIDLDPSRNGLRMLWPDHSQMPFEVIKMFARRGWWNLGVVIGSDSMHAEAIRH